MAYRKLVFQVLVWLVGISLVLPNLSFSGQWVNPKELIENPDLARLQNGKTELTPREKGEITRYGYTALELMIYAYANREPGQDWDNFNRLTRADPNGHIQINEWLQIWKYYYKDIKALITNDGIKPGEVQAKMIGIGVYPPSIRDETGV